MKILIIQPWISYRGAESVSVEEAYYLKKLGHQTAVAAIFVDKARLPEHGREADYLLPPKILSRICQKSRLVLFLLGPICLFWVVLKVIKSCDVLNPHNLPSVWIAAVLGKLYGKKVIWTAHGVPTKVSWKEKKSIFEYFVWFFGASWINIWTVRMTNLIISPSTKLAKQIKSRYGKNAVVLYNGISETPANADILPKEILKLRAGSDLLLLHVGNLHQQKGQIITLQLVNKLRKKGIETAAVFVGDGPDKNKLNVKSEKLEIKNHVFFTGYIPHKKIGAYYEVCDLVVLPSVNETFSAVPLEALSHGRCTLVSTGAGVKEVLNDYHLFASPTADDFYKKTILFLENRDLYQKKVKAGKIFVNQKFSWTAYCKTFTKEAQNLLYERTVSPTIYNKAYYGVHYEYPAPPLREERVARLKRAQTLARIGKDNLVLDLGCGNGELSILLAKKGARVWGIDYSRDAIKISEEKKKQLPSRTSERIHFAYMDAGNLTFEDNFFDRIICLDVFEHIYPPALEKVLTEIKRVIAPGGLAVIETFPNGLLWNPITFLAKKILKRGTFEHDKYHINIFNYFSFKRTLEKLSNEVYVDVVNDGHKNFSSRLIGFGNVPSAIKLGAKFADFALENPISERIIQTTPLKVFLSHDLWGVVRVKK